MPCVLDLEPAAAPKLGEGSKVVHRIDPCKDPRWSRLLERHPRASVFHSTAWLQALSRTYGYEPVAYVTCRDDGELANGIVFCRVESRLTGRRLVSLPFSDHCDPLVDSIGDLQLFATTLEEESRDALWRYIEIRPVEQREIATRLPHSDISYSFHQLDLRPDLDTLLRSFHKNSTQRKIRRAEREGLTYDEGSSELLDSFYRLLTITRRRHKIPPQPKKWFRNLMECFGESLKVRVARKDGRVIAGMLTLRYKDTLVYKYGCSDTRFNSVGGMHFLLWKAIQEAKNSGLRTFDLGRTDADQTGLVTFKNRWGTTRQVLTYSRYVPVGKLAQAFEVPATHWRLRTAKRVFAHLHPAVLSMLGRFLYRHAG
jgi:CelD/BcsL family acetyltransferase involved in cellulose biosynthesis